MRRFSFQISADFPNFTGQEPVKASTRHYPGRARDTLSAFELRLLKVIGTKEGSKHWGLEAA